MFRFGKLIRGMGQFVGQVTVQDAESRHSIDLTAEELGSVGNQTLEAALPSETPSTLQPILGLLANHPPSSSGLDPTTKVSIVASIDSSLDLKRRVIIRRKLLANLRNKKEKQHTPSTPWADVFLRLDTEEWRGDVKRLERSSAEFAGYIFCVDGSRYVQIVLTRQDCPPEFVESLLSFVNNHLTKLIVHPQAKYVVEKMCDLAATSENSIPDIQFIDDKLKGSYFNLACDPTTCRLALLLAIQRFPNAVKELLEAAGNLIEDEHGHRIIDALAQCGDAATQEEIFRMISEDQNLGANALHWTWSYIIKSFLARKGAYPLKMAQRLIDIGPDFLVKLEADKHGKKAVGIHVWRALQKVAKKPEAAMLRLHGGTLEISDRSRDALRLETNAQTNTKAASLLRTDKVDCSLEGCEPSGEQVLPAKDMANACHVERATENVHKKSHRGGRNGRSKH